MSSSKILITEKILSPDEEIMMRTIGSPSKKFLRATRKNPTERTVYVYKLGLADLGPNGELPNARTYRVKEGVVINNVNENDADNLNDLFSSLEISTARGKGRIYKMKSRRNRKRISKRNKRSYKKNRK
jgi:hypothetical protein